MATRARYGIDKRDPTADKRIFEFCYSIPIDQFVAEAQSRSLVRRAMQGRLPASTLARSVRGQQGADWYLTVEQALPSFRAEFPALQHSPLAHKFLDLDRMSRLLQTWPETGHEGDAITDSWNYALTRGISLGYMLRAYGEKAGQPAAELQNPVAATSETAASEAPKPA